MLALVAAVEDTAAELGHAGDHRRLCAAARPAPQAQVTPDPGVIEVNIHPARDWDELVDTRPSALRGGAAVAASAPRSSCSTAATPAPAAATTSCSAARRRPTARSCGGRTCCAAWSPSGSNHPSLSYLFSGLFIGPTSQAPRVDEARHDSLYELEIAFAPDPEPGGRRCRRGWSTGCSATC